MYTSFALQSKRAQKKSPELVTATLNSKFLDSLCNPLNGIEQKKNSKTVIKFAIVNLRFASQKKFSFFLPSVGTSKCQPVRFGVVVLVVSCACLIELSSEWKLLLWKIRAAARNQVRQHFRLQTFAAAALQHKWDLGARSKNLIIQFFTSNFIS